MEDHYSILGIPRDATTAEVNDAFRSLAKILHPDKPGGSEEKFRELNEAHQILSDPQKREEYDRVNSGRSITPYAQMIANFGRNMDPDFMLNMAESDINEQMKLEAAGRAITIAESMGDIKSLKRAALSDKIPDKSRCLAIRALFQNHPLDNLLNVIYENKLPENFIREIARIVSQRCNDKILEALAKHAPDTLKYEAGMKLIERNRGDMYLLTSLSENKDVLPQVRNSARLHIRRCTHESATHRIIAVPGHPVVKVRKVR